MTIPAALLEPEQQHEFDLDQLNRQPQAHFSQLEEPILALVLDHPEQITTPYAAVVVAIKQPHLQVIARVALQLQQKYKRNPTRAEVDDYFARRYTVDDEHYQEVFAFLEHYKPKDQDLITAQTRLQELTVEALFKEVFTSDEFFAAQTSGDFATMMLAMADAQRKLRELGIGAGTSRFHTISAAELATGDYALNYLVDGVLVEGQPCIVGGPQKGLKTSIAIDLAISLAVGGCFLGRFPVANAKRVGVLSSESGMGSIQDTAIRVCAASHYTLATIQNLIFCDVVPRLMDTADMADFASWLDKEKPEVVILDPFYLMASGDGAENVFKMGQLLRSLAELCLERKITPVVCHHLRKTRINPHAPAGLEELTYAGCAEFFRQWLLLSRREPYESDGNHKLWLTVGGSAGHSSEWALDVSEGSREDENGRHWRTVLLRSNEAREAESRQKQEAKQSTVREELIGLIKQHGPLRPNQVVDYSSYGKGTVLPVLHQLAAEGVIESRQIRYRNNSTEEFRIAGEGSVVPVV